MSGENWRPEIDAADFFGNGKKRQALEQRRPVIRKASDLVGPGIGANTTLITNFNDPLAMYNGFFSAKNGADNAPSSGEFVGLTISDDSMGGTQQFTRLSDGAEFSRVFHRAAADAQSITWDAWVPSTDLRFAAGDIIIKPLLKSYPGWLLCDGAAVSRDTYSALYTEIGTYYGPGDGSTTFNVPNTRGLFVRGASSTIIPGLFGGSLTVEIEPENLPPHAHDMSHTHSMDHNHTIQTRDAPNGANVGHVTSSSGASTPVTSSAVNAFDGDTGPASASSTGLGPGSGVPLDITPPWVAMPYYIKT